MSLCSWAKWFTLMITVLSMSLNEYLGHLGKILQIIPLTLKLGVVDLNYIYKSTSLYMYNVHVRYGQQVDQC